MLVANWFKMLLLLFLQLVGILVMKRMMMYATILKIHFFFPLAIFSLCLEAFYGVPFLLCISSYSLLFCVCVCLPTFQALVFCCSTGQVIPCCPLVKLYFSFIFSFTLKAWQGERLLGCFPQGIDLEECKDCARAASTFCSAADVWREPAHLYAAEWEWWVCILALSNLLKKKKRLNQLLDKCFCMGCITENRIKKGHAAFFFEDSSCAWQLALCHINSSMVGKGDSEH